MTDTPVRRRLWGAIALVSLPAVAFVAAGMLSAGGEGEDRILLCRHAELDRGSSQGTNLAAVRRAYVDLRRNLEKSLAVQNAKVVGTLDLAHDAGLPRCGFARTRDVTLKEALPAQFRARSFYFVSVEDVSWETEIAKNECAQVLVVKAKRPSEVGEVARRLKRPITFATKDLADALGVTCAPTKVVIGENGRDLLLTEGR